MEQIISNETKRMITEEISESMASTFSVKSEVLTEDSFRLNYKYDSVKDELEQMLLIKGRHNNFGFELKADGYSTIVKLIFNDVVLAKGSSKSFLDYTIINSLNNDGVVLLSPTGEHLGNYGNGNQQSIDNAQQAALVFFMISNKEFQQCLMQKIMRNDSKSGTMHEWHILDRCLKKKKIDMPEELKEPYDSLNLIIAYKGKPLGWINEVPTKGKRESAMEWWNRLPFNSSNDVSKQHYYDKYFVKGNKATMAKNYTQLTGREIEAIWIEEIGLKQAENG